MIIGLLKEIKICEYRVALTPHCVEAYIQRGHKVLVEKQAGINAGFTDEAYEKSGAVIVKKQRLFDEAQMIIKVKEPLKEEYKFFQKGQILYAYLHLAANAELASMLLEKRIKAVAYETITSTAGVLPCLQGMSEIAGRLAVQVGAKCLEKSSGGKGILLGGCTGVSRGHVVILGGGVVGLNACKIAMGLGAHVRILDISSSRLAYFDDLFSSKVDTLFSNRSNILKAIAQADLVIGAVLIPGAKAPKLVLKEDLKQMKKRAVIVDVAVDQGGCFETSKLTSYDNPVFIEEDILHCCVDNLPGNVPVTSSLALTSATLEKGLNIASKGLEKALLEDENLLNGLNTYDGAIVNKSVASSLGQPFSKPHF